MLDDLDAEEFIYLHNRQVPRFCNIFMPQRISQNAKLFIGSGKAEEIAEVIQALEADLSHF